MIKDSYGRVLTAEDVDSVFWNLFTIVSNEYTCGKYRVTATSENPSVASFNKDTEQANAVLDSSDFDPIMLYNRAEGDAKITLKLEQAIGDDHWMAVDGVAYEFTFKDEEPFIPSF